MDIVSVGSLEVGSLRWQARPGTWVLTVVCKATFQLLAGEAALADAQEHVNDDDGYWDDDPRKSLRFGSDLVPYKGRSDVLLCGSAYAPSGRPTASLQARLIVGEVDKSIAVHADRAFSLDGALRDGPRFTKMPLRWERAAGGLDTSNPVGVDPGVSTPLGELPLPNLLPIGYVPLRPREIIEPVCFAPLAPTWPGRRDKLGPHAGRFTLASVVDAVLPRELDPNFFQIAPPDQRPSTLAEDAQIVLENLHPHHARLVTRLPGLRAKAFVERNGTPQDLPMRPDTLAIDTDRGVVTLVWRGQLPLLAKDEPSRVVVVPEPRGSKMTWQDVARILRVTNAAQAPLSPPRADSFSNIESLTDDDFRPADETIPPGLSAKEEAAQTMMIVDGTGGADTLPFAAKGDVADQFRRLEQAAAEGRAAALPVGWGPAQLPKTPELPRRQEPGLPGTTPSLPAESVPVVAPPPYIAGRPAFLVDVDPPMAPPPKPPEVVIAPLLAKATNGVSEAAHLGLVGLSNAAVGAQGVLAQRAQEERLSPSPALEKVPVEPAGAALSKEPFDLLWHGPELAKKLRRDLGWRRLFLESDLEPPEENELEVMSEEDAETPEEADRRRIADALAKGTPVGIEALREAVRKGVRASGRFEAPVLLLEGELELTFDEVAMLRAVTAASAPFAPLHKGVKDAVDAAQEALKAPWIEGAAQVAEGYTERLREAFSTMRREAAGGGKRPIAADYLDTIAVRSLVMGRQYQKRPVHGAAHLRALLRLTGGEEKVVVYLPEDVGQRLPLSAKFRARVFAEVGGRVDPAEGSRWAGRGTAVGTASVTE